MGDSPTRRAKMRKKMSKVWGKIRKNDLNLGEQWGKWKLLLTRDCETGYGPEWYGHSIHITSSLAISGHQKTVGGTIELDGGTEEDPVTLERRGPAHYEDMGSSILSARAQYIATHLLVAIQYTNVYINSKWLVCLVLRPGFAHPKLS